MSAEQTDTASAEQALHVALPAALGRKMRHFAMTGLGAILLLALWEAAVRWLRMPPYILPSPLAVLDSLSSGLAVPFDSRLGFYLPLASTLVNMAWGFLCGGMLGIVLGSLMAEFPSVERLLMPYAFALQVLPKIAIAPLVVIWFGFGSGSKIAMAALLAFFPLMVNTFTGMRTVDPASIDLLRSLSASRFEIYRIVKLPAAAPYIFAGVDMGLVYALLGTIVAEFLGAQQGIGVTITRAQTASDVATVFAALILLGGVGMVLHTAVHGIERRIVHWTGRSGN